MMIKVQVGRSIESGGVESKQSLCMHTIGIGVFDHDDDDDDDDDDVDDYDGNGDGDGQNFTLKNSSLNRSSIKIFIRTFSIPKVLLR